MDDRVREHLQAIDAHLAATPPSSALKERIAESIGARGVRTSTRKIVLAVAAVALLAFVVGRRTAPRSERAAVEPTPTIATASPLKPSTPVRTYWGERLTVDHACDVREQGEVISIASGCRLRSSEPPLTLEVWSDSRIARAEHGVRVLDGFVAFAVDPVPAGAPRTRVEVAAGAIEVIGTRFVVVQHGDDGHVDLLEGSIELVTDGGDSRSVEQGRRLSWSAGVVEPSPIAAAAVGPSSPRPKPNVTNADDLDAKLEQIASLRRSGRYSEAIAILKRARRTVTDPVVAEVLSYEEGTLRMRDDSSAEICAYWRGHLARFGSGKNDASIRGHMTTASCDDR